MVADVQYLLIFIVATAGAISTAVLGWLDSGEAFNPRKFASSVLRAVGGGVAIVAVEFVFPAEVTLQTYFLAALAGMGVDALGNRAAGAIKAGSTNG